MPTLESLLKRLRVPDLQGLPESGGVPHIPKKLRKPGLIEMLLVNPGALPSCGVAPYLPSF